MLPFGFTVGYLYGHGSGNVDVAYYNEFDEPVVETVDFSSTTEELQFGLKKVWKTGRIGEAFAEGGATYGYAKGSVPGYSSSDRAFGPWVGGGYLFRVANHVAIGPRAQYSYYKTDIAGVNANGGGLHIGAMFAYRW